jgi:acetyl-CoA acetyltransferase family protein
MHDTSFGWRFVNPQLDELYGTESMGQTAENLVDLYGISRVDQDAFACWSQEKAAARDSFRAEEIIQVSIPRRKQESLIFEKDEFVRANTTKAVLAKLHPAFRDKNGTVTAGNASGLNDGSAALLMASAGGLEAHGLDPLAQVVSSAVVGVEPRVMGIGPVRASNLALERAGLTMADMDLIELNEAFSAQALACIREWGLDDRDPRINPQGGAIALGHPLGMTGARLLLTAAKQLRRTEKKFALVTLCIGVGQGYATILQNPRLGA